MKEDCTESFRLITAFREHSFATRARLPEVDQFVGIGERRGRLTRSPQFPGGTSPHDRSALVQLRCSRSSCFPELAHLQAGEDKRADQRDG